MIINNDAHFPDIPIFYPTLPLKGNKVAAVTGMADRWTEANPKWYDLRDGNVNKQVPVSTPNNDGSGLLVNIPYNRSLSKLPSMVILYITQYGGYQGMVSPLEFIILPNPLSSGGYQCFWSFYGWQNSSGGLEGSYGPTDTKWDYESDCKSTSQYSVSVFSGVWRQTKNHNGDIRYLLTDGMHNFFLIGNNSYVGKVAGIKQIYYDNNNIHFTLYSSLDLYCSFYYRGFIFE